MKANELIGEVLGHHAKRDGSFATSEREEADACFSASAPKLARMLEAVLARLQCARLPYTGPQGQAIYKTCADVGGATCYDCESRRIIEQIAEEP
jgi:hypothetical protein